MPSIAPGFDAKSPATTQPTAECHVVPSTSSHLMKAPSHRQTGVALWKIQGNLWGLTMSVPAAVPVVGQMELEVN